jgi:hypothetical protein
MAGVNLLEEFDSSAVPKLYVGDDRVERSGLKRAARLSEALARRHLVPAKDALHGSEEETLIVHHQHAMLLLQTTTPLPHR